MRTLTTLWLLFAAVIAYGSVYPFDFQTGHLDRTAFTAFLGTCCARPGRGDVLGNILLFLPFGFLGALGTGKHATQASRLALIVVGGVVFAFVLQVVQIYLPSRDQNLQDVLWNGIGIVAGALVGHFARDNLTTSDRPQTTELLSVMLIGSWLIYRLVPFVPSIDLQVFITSIKPVFREPQLQVIAILHDVVAWLVVASALRRMHPGVGRDRFLALLIAAVFVLEILIIDNQISLANLVGAILAIAVWFGGLRRLRSEPLILSVLLVAAIAAQGLQAMPNAPLPERFYWLPFRGLLGGSMYLNVESICEKVFFYGGLVYFLAQTRLGLSASAVLACLVVTAIEIAQLRIGGHTAEITDPLLVILAALTIAGLGKPAAIEISEPTARPTIGKPRRQKKPGVRKKRRKRSRSAQFTEPQPQPQPEPVSAPGESVKRKINLLSDQAAFLSRLAKKFQISRSRLTQRIIDTYIQQHPDPASAPKLGKTIRRNIWDWSGRLAKAAARRQKWVKRSLQLRQDQVAYIDRLAATQDLSFSRVTRRIIAQSMHRD